MRASVCCRVLTCPPCVCCRICLVFSEEPNMSDAKAEFLKDYLHQDRRTAAVSSITCRPLAPCPQSCSLQAECSHAPKHIIILGTCVHSSSGHQMAAGGRPSSRPGSPKQVTMDPTAQPGNSVGGAQHQGVNSHRGLDPRRGPSHNHVGGAPRGRQQQRHHPYPSNQRRGHHRPANHT